MCKHNSPADEYPHDRQGPCPGCPYRRSNLTSPEYAAEGLILTPERLAEVSAGLQAGINYGCHEGDADGDDSLACYGQMALVAALCATDPAAAEANAYRQDRYRQVRPVADLVTNLEEWRLLMSSSMPQEPAIPEPLN